MEAAALPLARGSINLTATTILRKTANPPPHANSAHTFSPSVMLYEKQMRRRVGSFQDHSVMGALLKGNNSLMNTGANYGGALYPLRYGSKSYHTEELKYVDTSSFQSRQSAMLEGDDHNLLAKRKWEKLNQQAISVMVNGTSGVIAFLLSSTLAVSCASVTVGHGTPLSTVIAHFIDMNLLGTAVLSIVLAWQSQAPWTLGAIDVFVAPIMNTMSQNITSRLKGDLELVFPTTVMMIALTSALLGLVFLLMGTFRVTSIANYMPYPVIAGFLSGIGAELMHNGVHMASSKAFTMDFFTLEQQLLILPALGFAALARLGRYWKWPVAISFPCILVLSLVGFHFFAKACNMSMKELKAEGWVFSWKHDVIRSTPMWYTWMHVDFTKIQWNVIIYECFGLTISLVLLGALKYSVATTSLSTLFGREISPDNEMRVIGLANIVSGVLGCCGGCHYLSAMGIMKQFDAHEKVPALVCAGCLIALWFQGIQSLQYVPKFVFGGLLLSVGLHFLEAYFVAPFQFLKPLEKGIVTLITLSFLVIGMLPSVGMGIIISMIDLIFRIHEVGCVHHETTGALTRSAVDRTPEQAAFLDAEGSAIFILRLQGYLFFGTSVNILERIETRMRSLDFPKLQFVVIDFGLVPSFDATALLNFRKVSALADMYLFDIYFCGLKQSIELALRQNQYSNRVHFLSGNVDTTLEICENQLLPQELMYHTRGTVNEWKCMSQLELWENFMCLHDEDHVKKLLPLAAYLDIVVIAEDSLLSSSQVVKDTYFICFGYMNVMTDSEFSNENIPGVYLPQSGKPNGSEIQKRKLSFIMTEESQWTPFTTAQSRLRKIGPGSIITPHNLHGSGMSSMYDRHIATSDCVLLRLSTDAMDKLEAKAPHTAVEVLKLINTQLDLRYLYSNKRVSQLSSLLYK